MPVLRPSGSDFTSFVKAAAQYVPAGGGGKVSKSGGVSVALPGLGAVVRTSQVGALASPTTSAVVINGITPSASAPPSVPPPAGLTLTQSGTGIVGAWTAYTDALGYTYTLYSNSIYSYVGGTLVTTASPTPNTFTYASPVSGTYYYYTLNVTTASGTSTLATSGIGQYVTPATISYVASNAVVTQLRDSGGTAIAFNITRGVAQLSNGNIVVADYSQRVRMITPAGVVSVLAGTGAAGSNDGAAASATFNTPQMLAVIPSTGVIVMPEYDNNRIRLIDPNTGVVSTLAGSTQGSNDGTGAAASFYQPYGVAVISSNLLVVTDTGNHRIRLVTYPGGVVSTLAGSGTPAFANGTGAGASFNSPIGIAYDTTTSTIIVGDTINNRIRLVTYPGGVVTTLAGSGNTAFADGTGPAASFYYPVGVSLIPSRNLIVVDDHWNHRIRLVTYPGGAVTTLAGSGYNAPNAGRLTDGTGTAADFYWPSFSTVLSNGNILDADSWNNRVRLISFPNAPLAPTSPTLSITSGTGTLGWTVASGATAYNWILYMSSNSNYNGTSNASGSTSSNAPTSAPTGLSAGYFWYFTVASSNASGVSSAIASSIVSY
jgi:hypothetical protein